MAKREDFKEEMDPTGESKYYKLGKTVKDIQEGGVGKALTDEIEKLLDTASTYKKMAQTTKDQKIAKRFDEEADRMIKEAAEKQAEAKKNK